MSAVVSWIKSIACYVIIISMFQGILPDNRYKKYVQLFTGMVLVLLIAAPILKLTGQEQNLTDVFAQYAGELLDSGISGTLENLQLESYYKAELTQLLNGCGYELSGCTLRFDTEGRIAQMSLMLQQSDGELVREVVPVQVDLSSRETDGQETENLKRLLAEAYDIEESQITIRIN